MWKYNSVFLVVEGTDTFSSIFVNNIEVGSTSNMFVKYIFNLKTFIRVSYWHLYNNISSLGLYFLSSLSCRLFYV